MIPGKVEDTWELTPAELEERLARCHRCGDPMFITNDPNIGVAMVQCGSCGATAAVSAVSNLPADWAEEASREELHFAVKEEALELTDRDDLELAQLGEIVLDIIDSGGDDAAGLARARNQLAADPRFGAESGIVRALDALMESL